MEAPLLWFCDAIYVPLHKLIGVSRRMAVVGCIGGMAYASALSVINATGHRLFLGWLNAGLMILWIGLLAFNEWGPLSVVTTTGHRKTPTCHLV